MHVPPFLKRIPVIAGLTVLVGGLFFSAVALADHAIAMHGAPKYAADFDHLDYVNASAPKGGTLRLAKSGSFDNLNNHIITGTNAEGLEHVNDRLMQRVWDEPFALYGVVAQSIDISDDRSEITFHLNPAARFHDGIAMTTKDVKFSYDAYRTFGHPVRRRVYGLVETVDIIDDHTIHFKFGKGFDRESVLILAMMPVLPEHYWKDRDISKTTLAPPLGSGPYKIASVDAGRKITYERVKDWWAKDLAVNKGQYNFDTITYSYFRDDDIALQAFKAGEYDVRREYDMTKWMSGYEVKGSKPAFQKEEIAHGRPEWLRGLIFNTRRAIFSDIRVRQALGYMLNDEWINKTLYHGALKRIDSSFSNSYLAASGVPSADELALLKPYRADIPTAVFETAWQPPAGNMRARQRQAIALLKEAGWQYDTQGVLRDESGAAFSFEILLADPNEEKIALEFSRALKRIGIALRVRTVDSAQFAGRLEDFDYDMVSFRWINSLSPGNEQVNYWGSVAAQNNGSRNYAGVSSPAVDAVAGAIAHSLTREDLVTRTHALDRLIMQGYYMIPLFYQGRDLVARNFGIERPEQTPVYGVVLESWWQSKSLSP